MRIDLYPTVRLRFVLRSDGNREVRTLQQWFEAPVADPRTGAIERFDGEWRDVPLEQL